LFICGFGFNLIRKYSFSLALETQLKKRGAVIEKSKLFQEKVMVDQRLVKGQNSASVKGVAKAILGLLQSFFNK
jgi:hypothetical protein